MKISIESIDNTRTIKALEPIHAYGRVFASFAVKRRGVFHKLLIVVLTLGGLCATQGATVINLDATVRALGPLDPWPNTGTISGDFNAAATPWTYTPGQVITVDGVKGVAIPTSTLGTLGTAYEGPIAPETMCGGTSQTIEAWVWDPQLQGEKTVVAWGRRNGPDGSNCTFGHGNSTAFGFLGGWGFADIGITNVPSTLAGQRWTYVVYTYDSASRVATIYQDGVLVNVESYPTTPLITIPTTRTAFQSRSGWRGKRMPAALPATVAWEPM